MLFGSQSEFSLDCLPVDIVAMRSQNRDTLEDDYGNDPDDEDRPVEALQKETGLWLIRKIAYRVDIVDGIVAVCICCPKLE